MKLNGENPKPYPNPKGDIIGTGTIVVLGEEYNRVDEYERVGILTDGDRNELPPPRPPLEAASLFCSGRAKSAPPITRGAANFLQLVKKLCS